MAPHAKRRERDISSREALGGEEGIPALPLCLSSFCLRVREGSKDTGERG